MAARNRIPELEAIEFTGHQAVADYSGKLRDLNAELAHEVDFAAEELQAVLGRQRGHPALLGVDTRLRARKVAKRLRRCAELSAGAAYEAMKFYAEFRLQFDDVITPVTRPSARNFDFNDA